MTTVVFGANGMVGRALMEYLSDAVGTYNNSKDNLIDGRCYEWLDVTLNNKVEEFCAKHKPDKIFIACANPNVDGCENPSSDGVNTTGIIRLVHNNKEAQIVFFSSSYVFEGTSQTPYKTTDAPFPVNRYGRQKEVIEILLTQRKNALVIRTVGVFGKEGTGKNFVDQVKRAVKENKKICVPSDQTMNPVWVMDLAKTAIHIASRNYEGIHHVSGDKCVSKYEWAISIAYKLGCKKPHELIVGMKTADMNQLANRPLNGCLDCNGLTALAMTVPNLEKGLDKYLMVATNSKSKS